MASPNPIIRLLTPEDADLYSAIRLRGVWEHPEAFLARKGETAPTTANFAARLAEPGEDGFVLGAFEDGSLIGTIGLARNPDAPQSATLWGHYVAPEHRRHGIAEGLLAATLRRARNLPRLEVLVLDARGDNAPARRMYANAGFEGAALDGGTPGTGDTRMTLRLRPQV